MTTTVKRTSRGYNYTYADLAAIHEELERQGITYRQFISYEPTADADYIYTILTVNGKELDPLQGCRVVMGETAGKMSAAQMQGSALTYARRYSLLMALGWATEDDDGASAGAVGGRVESPTSRAVAKIDFREFGSEAESMTLDELRQKYTEVENGGYSPKQKAILLRILTEVANKKNKEEN